MGLLYRSLWDYIQLYFGRLVYFHRIRQMFSAKFSSSKWSLIHTLLASTNVVSSASVRQKINIYVEAFDSRKLRFFPGFRTSRGFARKKSLATRSQSYKVSESCGILPCCFLRDGFFLWKMPSFWGFFERCHNMSVNLNINYWEVFGFIYFLRKLNTHDCHYI